VGKATYGIGSDENIDEPNVWLPETTLPGFRAFMTKFYWESWKTSQNVLRALALGLGFDDEGYLLQFHSGHDNEIALRNYPPIAESAIANEKVKRLSPHTDFDSFTLLFQDDCGGLEVQKPGFKGEFFPADPIKGALVMNIGDVLMRWSNGEFKLF
jgi:isopenicillin N synthase-like dioxygenase